MQEQEIIRPSLIKYQQKPSPIKARNAKLVQRKPASNDNDGLRCSQPDLRDHWFITSIMGNNPKQIAGRFTT
ncbi:hypothetical protein [Polaromonas sp. OV174]|uniref:hypothetical protein n=1 Tax=Polaromonas sp. OV174 TaxID=1855300 RepID=UPI001160723D|nr:hypothetical protein [Polaromonas sp. OV174]